jgi:putative endonuclease
MPASSWLSQRLSQLRTTRQRSGDAAEEQALQYLDAQGLRLVQRSFLCKGGEIDLIMQEGDCLVFIEVRSRASSNYGGAVASITPQKQRRWQHAAQVYLSQLKKEPTCRFDVVAIEQGQLTWLKNVLCNY